MTKIRKHSRLLLVALTCVVAGAGASAIASAGAASGPSVAHHRGRSGLRAAALRHLGRGSVQGSLVVDTRTGFATVTFERGKIDSVSGQQLTMTEGTRKASYKTVTLTIPASARIRDNRQKATMSDLKPGQRVIVLTGPKRTFVIAHTPRAL